jgi:hypothetical protein
MNDAALWILGLLSLGVDGLVWGVAACTTYRGMAGHARRWLGPALVAGLVFVAWDQWVFGELAHWAGFPRGHRETVRLLEIGIQLAGTLLGFRAGELLVSAVVQREQRSRPSAAEAPRGGQADAGGRARGRSPSR